MALKDLYLPLNAVYFDQIKAGTKTEEYRLVAKWAKRLQGREFRHVILTRGYPKGGGIEGVSRLTRKWRCHPVKILQHPFFGPDAVKVYAIDVSQGVTHENV